MLIRSAEPYSFIYVSPAYERMLGRNAEELYENPAAWLTDVHETDRSQVADSIQAICPGHRRFQLRIQDARTQRSDAVDMGDRLP